MGELIKLNLIPDVILHASQTQTRKTAEGIKNIFGKNAGYDIPLTEEKEFDYSKNRSPQLQNIFKKNYMGGKIKIIMFVPHKENALSLAASMTGNIYLELDSFNEASVSGYTFEEETWEGFANERKKSSSMNIFYNKA